jgi:predicted membrane channel-forming protein YqfA (hemolysin III family)
VGKRPRLYSDRAHTRYCLGVAIVAIIVQTILASALDAGMGVRVFGVVFAGVVGYMVGWMFYEWWTRPNGEGFYAQRTKKSGPTYLVRRADAGTRWIIESDGVPEYTTFTQQRAIDQAKKWAIENRGRVEWLDEDGNHQGASDYRRELW